MASNGPNAVRQFLHGIFARQRTAESPDGLLLQRFVAQGDEDAFAALVKRHGPMVLGVCQRLLNDSHDAEDAFQATFLILARRAGSVGNPDLLAHWLYGVAYRVGVRARGARAKRRARERQVTDVPAQEPTPEMIWSDLRPVLDEEVNRLPAKYRIPFVLCYLEGKTNEEAAALLGSPRGTILSRLATARQRLRSRLTRRGITLSAGVLAAALSRQASAAVSPSLVASAVRAAAAAATGPAAGGAVSATVLALAEGVQKAMFWSKVRTTGVLLLATAALAGTLLLPGLLPSAGRPQAAASPPQPPPPAAGNAEPSAPPEVSRGSNYLVFPVKTELQRALLPGAGGAQTAKACMLIDGMSVVRPDGLVDSKALDFDSLRTALKPYRGKGQALIVYVYFSTARLKAKAGGLVCA
jgi:RNA polymerase sigma factor (sigma-70 family)